MAGLKEQIEWNELMIFYTQLRVFQFLYSQS